MAKAVAHFEIYASDIERAKKFYESVFEWKIDKWDGNDYWIIYAGRTKYPSGKEAGIDGGLVPRRGDEPTNGAAVNAYVCTIVIENIDATIGQVETAGGEVVVAKKALPKLGWTAYCKDPEGNIFGLMQEDQAAA